MMAISGDVSMFFGALPSHPNHRPVMPTFLCSKARLDHFRSGASDLKVAPNLLQMKLPDMNSTNWNHVCFGTGENKLTPTVNQDAEVFLLNVVNMSFFDRLSLTWRMLFPTKVRNNSNAKTAKQRLKMILFSDRCDISDEAKQKIINNIIEALSEFVEIDSLDKVQLNVSTDTDLGTLYSVTIPVRRVRPEYQDSEEDYIGNISNMEYKDTGERSGNIDVKFDFFLPSDQSKRVKWVSDK
ncbi:cell division topological specificity factor homolog, chloroplastic-like [Zingiber officinale]|uniref:cell division topological specificity factor homolog, chloroplastic-like n=1 Tax=Zingiber officinale TaxID=94328 RepID=UPI001C4A8DFC|nr:cell division topological specificity factor homolog, chloroplastic-like [Zingiber officinale]